MAEDFICGYPPKVTISGQTITWAAGEWDRPLFESFTTSDYVAFVVGSEATFQISSNDGEQADGAYDITVTGDISGYVSGTDMALPKVGSAVNHYTTLPTCKAAMDGISDRMLICYSDTAKNSHWGPVDLINGSASYNPYGTLPNSGISITTNIFCQFSGDLSAIADIGITNITLYGINNRIIYYVSTVDITGTMTVSRCRFMGASRGIQNANIPADKLVIESCHFEGHHAQGVNTFSDILINNCVFANGSTINLNGTTSTLTNCLLIDTELQNHGLSTFTTCLDTLGVASAAITLDEMKTWATEAYDGPTHNYYPASDLSPLVGTGTDCGATHDIHGRAFTSGSYPIGASLLFNMVDPVTGEPDPCTLDGVSSGNGELTLTISNSPDSTAVIYARIRTIGSAWSSRTFFRVGDGELTVTGLDNGTQYGVVAEAYYNNLYSAFSNEIMAMPSDGNEGTNIESAIYMLLANNTALTTELATYNGLPSIFTFSPIPSDAGNMAVSIESATSTTSTAASRVVRGGEAFIDVSIWGDKNQSEKKVRDTAWVIWHLLDRGVLSSSTINIIAMFASAPVRLSDPEGFPGYLVNCRVVFSEL